MKEALKKIEHNIYMFEEPIHFKAEIDSFPYVSVSKENDDHITGASSDCKHFTTQSKIAFQTNERKINNEMGKKVAQHKWILA